MTLSGIAVSVGYYCYCYLKTFIEKVLIESSDSERAHSVWKARRVLNVLPSVTGVLSEGSGLSFQKGLRVLTQNSHLHVRIFLNNYVFFFWKIHANFELNSIIHAGSCYSKSIVPPSPHIPNLPIQFLLLGMRPTYSVASGILYFMPDGETQGRPEKGVTCRLEAGISDLCLEVTLKKDVEWNIVVPFTTVSTTLWVLSACQMLG